jgi:hypothetical protein
MSQRALADPTDRVHHRVQRGEQQVPPAASLVPGVDEVLVSLIAEQRGEDGVDRLALPGGRWGRGQA